MPPFRIVALQDISLLSTGITLAFLLGESRTVLNNNRSFNHLQEAKLWSS